jgi:hypothetical protein
MRVLSAVASMVKTIERIRKNETGFLLKEIPLKAL